MTRSRSVRVRRIAAAVSSSVIDSAMALPYNFDILRPSGAGISGVLVTSASGSGKTAP